MMMFLHTRRIAYIYVIQLYAAFLVVPLRHRVHWQEDVPPILQIQARSPGTNSLFCCTRWRLLDGIEHVHCSTALCKSTSILRRGNHVAFVLASTCRHHREESKIVAFHVKITIFCRDSCIEGSS